MENTKMSDDVFQQKVLLELQFIRGSMATKDDMSALRTEIRDVRMELKTEIRGLRTTVLGGFQSMDKRIEILRKRIDRIERYLGW